MKILTILSIGCSVLSLATVSKAAIVTGTLNGTVTFGGFGIPEFQVGDIATITYSYDTATPSTSTATQQSYSPGTDPALLSMALTIQSSTIGAWNTNTAGGNFGTSRQAGGDELQLNSTLPPTSFDAGTTFSPNSFNLVFFKNNPSTIYDSSLDAPTTNNIGDWDQLTSRIYFDNFAKFVDITYTTQVPEPSSAILLATGTLGLVLRRKR